jgi:formamidopyrimidine-DNA glycosylase
MPELPEVEIAARNLRAWLRGRKIARAELPRSRVLDGEPRAAARLLAGRVVREIERRGKWLRFALSGGASLWSHLGMTGKWVRRDRDAPALRHERARLDAGRRSVRYTDPRLFGRLVPRAAGEPPPAAWLALGPDPLHDGVDPRALRDALARRSISIKEALLDQRVLAGVGNIQAQEALWRARIHPMLPAQDLRPAQTRALAAAILASMRDTIARETAPEITYVEEPGADNPFDVYGKHGAPCPRCGTTLTRIILAGRATVYCRKCQKR